MKIKFALLVLLGTSFVSCSKKFVGTWTIQKYETSTPSQPGVSLNNIGTMTFKKNGNGEKNISYTIFESTKEDKSNFEWTLAGNLLTIKSDGSEFSKTWIVIKDEKKFQKLQSTNGNNQVQVLELKKQ